ncbi:hypothetical protein JCM14469_09540 [Desulfatiferula olefinivorans]
MHLHDKLLISMFLISVHLITGGNVIADANHILSVDKADELNLVLNDFSDEQFSQYLKNFYNYNLEEHKIAIRNLFTLYRKDYAALEACSSNESGLRKEYSSDWLKDLKTKFGEDYVEKNSESIKTLLLNLFLINSSAYCIDAEKDLLYSEIQYIRTLKDFYQSYIDFYMSLSDNERKGLTAKKNKADELLKALSTYPMQDMLYGGRVGHYVGLENKVTLKKEVINLIINHPQFSKPFNVIHAVEDLLSSQCR